MPHLDLNPVTPEDLIAYIDGEATPDVVLRIEADVALRDEASAYAQIQGQARGQLWRFACPSPQDISEYALDIALPEERTRIAVHLHDCPRCTDELQLARGFLMQEPSPSLRTRIRRTIATLLAAPLAPALRVRGADALDTVRYQAGDVNVSLNHSRIAHGLITLDGLIWRDTGSSDAFANGTVSLIGVDSMAVTTPVDELGNFAFDNLPVGIYTLEVTLGDDVIVIAGLHLDP